MARWRAISASSGNPVGIPPLVQRPEIPVRTRRSLTGWVTIWAVRPWWLWRREQAVMVALLAGAAVGWRISGPWTALLVPVAVVGLVALVPEGRAAAVRLWRRGQLRRHWDRASRFADLATVNDRVPRIIREDAVPVGERLVVRMPRGEVVSTLEGAAEHLAAGLRVREVRVTRDLARADLARVQIVRRDPFEGRAAVPWPWLDRPRVSLWEPVPAAVDELDEPVSALLPGKHLLLGGEPESGKSGVLSLMLAAAALDPRTRIVGLDGKRVELAMWRPVMSRLVYADMDDAIGLVEDLVADMDRTYEALEEHGLRKVPDGAPLTLLVVDELRFYTAHAKKAAREKFTALAVDYVARGRAAGHVVVAATQKPSSDVVPTSLRDLFALRWAMRSTTRDASDTILGSGWASRGFDASRIPISQRGAGLILADGSPEPRRVLACYLTDEQITTIAARGALLRP